MRVTAVGPCFHEIDYETVDGAHRVIATRLPFTSFVVDRLPEELDGALLMADLQGREPRWSAAERPRLLGDLVAEDVPYLSVEGRIPPPSRIGIILAGDMFARPELDRRGGKGDVRDTWRAFAARCRWVVGVAGNHDVFGEMPPGTRSNPFGGEDGIHFLDGSYVELDGLRLAGVSGIIGNPSKPFRRDEKDFAWAVREALEQRPDILVLHEGPDVPKEGLRGSETVRKALEEAEHHALVVAGHTHWDVPLAKVAGNVQVLNVHERCVLLTRSERGGGSDAASRVGD